MMYMNMMCEGIHVVIMCMSCLSDVIGVSLLCDYLNHEGICIKIQYSIAILR